MMLSALVRMSKGSESGFARSRNALGTRRGPVSSWFGSLSRGPYLSKQKRKAFSTLLTGLADSQAFGNESALASAAAASAQAQQVNASVGAIAAPRNVLEITCSRALRCWPRVFTPRPTYRWVDTALSLSRHQPTFGRSRCVPPGRQSSGLSHDLFPEGFWGLPEFWREPRSCDGARQCDSAEPYARGFWPAASGGGRRLSSRVMMDWGAP